MIPAVLNYAVARKDTAAIDQQMEYLKKRRSDAIAAIDKVYKVDLHRLNAERRRLTRIMYPGEEAQQQQEKTEFMQKCRAGICEGFLSSSWKCKVCDEYTCKDCGQDCGELSATHENSDHVCNEDDKASFTLVRQQTKPCPKCATPIYKIEGCDQMWCTQCNTAFSWDTGRQVNGTVHNPHYFEWMRRQQQDGGEIARQPLDLGGCGVISLADIRTHLSIYREGAVLPGVKRCREMVQWLTDIELRQLVELRRESQDSDRIQKDRLSDFVTKEIDEGKFREFLIAKEKRDQFLGEIVQVLTTFVNIMKELLINRIREADNKVAMDLTEVKEFIVYIYNQMAKVEKVYKLKTQRYINPKNAGMYDYVHSAIRMELDK